MKKTKIFLIVTAILSVAAICLSVLAAADSTRTVQLVTLDYIENKVMPDVADKIKTDSPEAMKDTVAALNAAIDALNAALAEGRTNDTALSEALSELSGVADALLVEIDAGKAADSTMQASIAALSQAVTALQEQVGAQESTVAALLARIAALEEQLATAGDGYQKVVLGVGEYLRFLKEPACEIVVIAGELKVTAANSVVDLTGGGIAAPEESILQGQHLMVLAGNENSLVANAENTIILVKGEYEIVKQS